MVNIACLNVTLKSFLRSKYENKILYCLTNKLNWKKRKDKAYKYICLSIACRVIFIRMIIHIQSEIIKLYCNTITLNPFIVFFFFLFYSGKETAFPAVSQLLLFKEVNLLFLKHLVPSNSVDGHPFLLPYFMLISNKGMLLASCQ